MRRPSVPTGVVLFEGASSIDGAPIVVIATNLRRASTNAKTGDMIQTWILRADMPPAEAAASGADRSVCGDCMHRPVNANSCYVSIWRNGPRVIWEAFKRGRYVPADGWTLAAARRWFRGRHLRIGSYGDPAAAPSAMWRTVAELCEGVTGYTHQWASGLADGLRGLCMASVDSLEEAITARAAGWRTFRVREAWETLADREFVCPASEEAGYKTECAECKACGGLGSKAKASPVIVVHGGKHRRFALYRNGERIAA